MRLAGLTQERIAAITTSLGVPLIAMLPFTATLTLQGAVGFAPPDAPSGTSSPAQTQPVSGDSGRIRAAKFLPQFPEHHPADEQDLGDGLLIVDLETGDGLELTENSLAIVNYAGWLAKNQQLFDTTWNPGRSPFATGIPGRVIDGWNRGLIGMRAGGRRKLIVPAALGYGERATRRIPKSSDLVFLVELLEVVQKPVIDMAHANRDDAGAIWIDLAPGEGSAYEENGFASCHISLWDGQGRCMGSTRSRETPMPIQSDMPQWWMPYAMGMKGGGVRAVEADNPNRAFQQPGGEDESGNANEEQPDRWTLLIEMYDVQAAITQTPHDPEQVIEGEKGLKYVELKIGEGKLVEPPAIAAVNYSGWTEDGRLFDSTYKPGGSPMYVSPGLVIEGWEIGIKGMRVGGRRKLIIPPELAYGEKGYPRAGIPANATLIFEIEVTGAEMPLFMPDDPNREDRFKLFQVDTNEPEKKKDDDKDKSDKDKNDGGDGGA